MKRLKLRAAAIALMLLSATTAWADDNGDCGYGVTYTFVESTGTLTIIGSGAMANFAEDEIPWRSYRSNIKTVVIESGVTSIGECAFFQCDNVPSVTIPSSVTTIGSYAFCSCKGLTSITIPSSVTSIGELAFGSCDGLTSITIPSSVTSIGESAFGSCDGLTSITIPSSVTSIGKEAFSLCLGLTSVFILAPNLTTYGDDAFKENAEGRKIYVPNGSGNTYKEKWSDYSDDIAEITASGNCGKTGTDGSDVKWVLGDNGTIVIYGSGDMKKYVSDSGAPWNNYKSSIKTVVIENGVTTIGSNAFYLCQGLTSVTIPYGVKDIGGHAFHGCDKLASVTIPSSVTDIGDYAFIGCKALTSVTIPSSVTDIGKCAFFNTSLTSVNIPASVTSMGEEVFTSCSALESITVEKENPQYDSRDGCNAIIEKNGNTLILGCKNTVIPSSVTNIGKHAFDDCNGLTSVTIPSSVTNIGDHAFNGCTGLTLVTIPSSVTSIEEGAFYGCFGLTSVTIPASVTSIGTNAFMGCTGVSDVYCFADPDNLTWVESSNDFITDPDKTTKTVCHVAGSKLATFESKWNKGENTDVNVTFMGDGIEPGNQAYLAGMTTYKNGTPPEGVKAFLPVGYDLSTATVTLAEVKGAPKNLPAIYGSATEGEKLPDVFFLKYVADDSDEATDIQSDYDNALKGMDKRFVITDGTKTLADVISGTGVDAGEAVILVLANGKFTSVDFSAADLDKKAQAGLLLFVLSKWEYMQIKPSNSAVATNGNANTRTIGIGNGEATSLREVKSEEVKSEKFDADAWHDLQGRKISKPTKKGIYIYKGKKVLK